MLLPVWNGEAFLEQAMESILRQTLSSFELLVIDDGRGFEPAQPAQGFGLITWRASTAPSGRIALTMLLRTSTTSSGSTHQSDQEKRARSKEPGSTSSALPEATW